MTLAVAIFIPGRTRSGKRYACSTSEPQPRCLELLRMGNRKQLEVLLDSGIEAL